MRDVFDYASLREAADYLGCEVEIIQAVMQKEVQKSPWFICKGQRKLKILFERHKFWEALETCGASPNDILRRNPSLKDILNQAPYSKYGTFAEQYSRRERAMQVHKEAGLMACSYGGLQIMGTNYAELGYESIDHFVRDMEESPKNWLVAFVRFCEKNHLKEALQKRDFTTFARKYNGPNFRKNRYDIELSRIYQRILAASLPKPESKIAAVVQSKTVQRTVAATATAAAPGAGILMESGQLTDLLTTVKGIADQGTQVKEQIHEIQTQVAQLAPMIDWLTWAPIISNIIMLIFIVAMMWRYLHDRGYEP